MKKLYYFSKSKLQFIEIRNYKAKLVTLFTLAVFTVSFLIFGGYFLISSLTGSHNSLASLKGQNTFLRNKLTKVVDEYKGLNIQLDSLSNLNNNLRVAANLPPISREERRVGVGGGYFDNSLDFLTNPSDKKLKEAFAFVDEVSRKIEFEKTEYLEISKKLKENKKLYSAIPAIRPVLGPISDGFGMRYHPILHIRRMHDGIDIVTNIGTPVHSTGDGTIEYAGRDGGYGLVVKINHGFGYETVYGHLSKILVKEGQKVKRGQVIAKSGTSGLSTGPHVHYEVHHNGVYLNPEDFFFGNMGFLELTSKK